MPHHISIRAAEAGDVDDIHRLLAPFAEQDIILPRSEDDIFQHLQEFLVAEYDGALAGAAAMHIYASTLAEVRSLVVDPALQAHGIGRLLVMACEQWAAGLGMTCVFALTYVPDFFERMDYERVPKESLPHKIWTVCVHCKRFADCDEIAVRKNLTDASIKPLRVIPIIETDQA
ncbi:MAG: N-acetyltransferase [Mariprofundaceae bacterium]